MEVRKSWRRRFAVLICAEDSDYTRKKYGGFFEIYVDLLGDDGDAWDGYRVTAGEFPADEEVELYDGFVVTGSCYDAHGSDAWILRLLALLRRLHSMRKKVLGFCFGHQILGRALGGKTGRATSGWDIGLRTINFNKSTLPPQLQIPSPLSVIEIHQDEVRELPPSAEVMAWSEKTRVEMFRCGDHILGIQGHPEYNQDILRYLIDRLLVRNLIQDSQAEKAKESLEAGEPDREAWQKLCKAFLRGRSPFSHLK